MSHINEPYQSILSMNPINELYRAATPRRTRIRLDVCTWIQGVRPHTQLKYV